MGMDDQKSIRRNQLEMGSIIYGGLIFLLTCILCFLLALGLMGFWLYQVIGVGM